jgi:carboxymethylenebutenolidase
MAWYFDAAQAPRREAVMAAVEAAFAGQDCDYTQIIHPGAPHGYAIPDRDAYDKQATYRDWEHISAMYDRMLRGR